MVKHTQTIGRQQPTNFLTVSDHFVGLTLKGLSQGYNLFQYFLVLKSDKFENHENFRFILHKIWIFPLRIYSVNVTKSAASFVQYE